MFQTLHSRLARPVDPAGLAAFRVLFGLLLAVGNLRFLLSGWPHTLYGEPRFFFRFAGFEWVPALDEAVATRCYGAFVVCGVLIAAGFLYRPAIVVFTVLFAFVQLADVTNYLNHYWLVLLLAALLCVLPATACFAVDNVVFKREPRPIPYGAVVVVRFQVACVYVFAAVAKVGVDWLRYGQPLGVWLPGKDELAVIGPLLSMPLVSLLASWAGFLYDATIVVWLSWRRTRLAAYALVLVFHGLTSVFFSIGMFPVIMAVATTIFFAPSWPRDLLAWVTKKTSRTISTTSATSTTSTTAVPSSTSAPMPSPPDPLSRTGRGGAGGDVDVHWGRGATALLLVWMLVHVTLPLRCFVIGDDVLWDEAGMRFSWRVMVREKSGSLSYKVTLGPLHGGRVVVVNPHDRLTWRQVNEMIGQPDLILQLAHEIKRDLDDNGYGPVEVRADSIVTLNGRRSVRLIDPDVDLGAVDDCFFCRQPFILPAPTTTPPDPLRRLRR